MTLRLVFAGSTGHVGYVLRELADFDVQAVGCAPTFEGESMAVFEPLGIPHYSCWKCLLKETQPDIVVVDARYDLNAQISIAAMKQGAHVISEKPAALGLEDLAALRQIIAKTGRIYTLMLAIRYEPAFWTAHRLVSEGMIGDPVLVSGQKSYRWGASRPEWYADPSKYGSTMAWVGIHTFDFARWIAGVEFTEVYAHHANLVHIERPGCQDVATVIASLSNGGSAVFNIDYLRPEAAKTHGDDRVRVVGSRGIVEVCDEGRSLHVITPDMDESDYPLDTPDRSFFGDFVHAVEGTGDLLITADEGLSITEFALKAALAADTHKPVIL